MKSFYEIESGFSTMLQGIDRKKADFAANQRLRAKLLELQSCGLVIDLPQDATDIDDDIGGVLSEPRRAGRRLT